MRAGAGPRPGGDDGQKGWQEAGVGRQAPEALQALIDDSWSKAKQKVRRRLTAWLVRRGFSGSAMSEAIDHATRLASQKTDVESTSNKAET